MIEYNCIICNKGIRKLEDTNSPDWESMWDDGAVDKIACNYGSKFDGDMYTIGICDDCIKSKLNQGVIRYVGSYM